MSALARKPRKELGGVDFGSKDGFVEGDAEFASSIDLDADFDIDVGTA